MDHEPRTALYQTFAAITERQHQIGQQIGDLGGRLAGPAFFEEAVHKLTASIREAGEIQAKALWAHGVLMDRLASASERHAELLAARLVPGRDAPAAWLYACGVDRDGSFNQASHVGRFLIQACKGCDSLRCLVASKAGKREFMERAAFVDLALRIAASDPAIPDALGEYDLARFYELAPGVLRLAEWTPAPSTTQAAPQPEGAAE